MYTIVAQRHIILNLIPIFIILELLQNHIAMFLNIEAQTISNLPYSLSLPSKGIIWHIYLYVHSLLNVQLLTNTFIPN